MEAVTVAIPVRNGGPFLAETLAAVRAQRLDRPLELLVADSGSTDGSLELARRHGARLLQVPPSEFSHGGTRDLLARTASGTHIAFLTQDATPADDGWLARLLGGFALGDRVGLVYGSYRPRPGASPWVRRQLETWFASLSPDGLPKVERGLPDPADPDAIRRLFFTDANGCVDRRALEAVPFRAVAYAEDQLLARDMLGAGFAKVFVPDAQVIHSHDYPPLDVLRRAFDEWRGLRDVHGIGASIGPLPMALTIQRKVRDDLADAGGSLWQRALWAPAAVLFHLLEAIGAALGSRSGSLPRGLRRKLSLEGRG
jgi:glycosyltransferase involved in cell wall biosynthesis